MMIDIHYNLDNVAKYAQYLTKKKNLSDEEKLFLSRFLSYLNIPFQFKKYFKYINKFDDNFKKEILLKFDRLIYKNNDWEKYYSNNKELTNEFLLNLLSKNDIESAKKFFEKTNYTKTNWNFTETKYLYYEFDFEDKDSVEIGIFFIYLPIIQYLKNKYNIKKIFVSVTHRLNSFINKYFPYIENIKPNQIDYVKSKIHYIGRIYSQINFFDMQNSSSILEEQIQQIRQNIVKNNQNSNKLGFLWYSNSLSQQHKSIPVGIVINTLGNNQKQLNLKCLQYNDAQEEIQLFNKQSKNKISEIFYNDLDTDVCDIVDAVAECKAVIGTSNFVLIANMIGIPSLLTGSSPHHHWYASSDILPYLTPTNMNFYGDYEGLYKSIYDFVDKHFD